MEITRHTKLEDAKYFLNDTIIDQICKQIKDEDIKDFGALVSLCVGDFIRLLKGYNELVFTLFFKDKKDVTVWNFCKRLEWIKREVENISKFLKTMEIKQTDEEKQAARGVPFLSFEQNIITYCQKRFFLKSLQEAESIKLSDFLLCKKEDYANMIFEKNLRTIYDRKMKQKMKSTK